MIPSLSNAVNLAVALIEGSLVPDLRTGYLRKEAWLCKSSLQCVVEKLDSAVADLLNENQQLEGLITKARQLGVASAGEGAFAMEGADLHMSSLTSRNGKLRTLLVEVHAELDTRDGEDVVQLKQAVWLFMFASVERAAFITNPFAL